MRNFDLVIIGGGAAGFAAATKANDLGLSVVVINDGLPIGGTCVNVGCVPSKHLLHLAELAHRPRHPGWPAVGAGGSRRSTSRRRFAAPRRSSRRSAARTTSTSSTRSTAQSMWRRGRASSRRPK